MDTDHDNVSGHTSELARNLDSGTKNEVTLHMNCTDSSHK